MPRVCLCLDEEEGIGTSSIMYKMSSHTNCTVIFRVIVYAILPRPGCGAGLGLCWREFPAEAEGRSAIERKEESCYDKTQLYLVLLLVRPALQYGRGLMGKVHLRFLLLF